MLGGRFNWTLGEDSVRSVQLLGVLPSSHVRCFCHSFLSVDNVLFVRCVTSMSALFKCTGTFLFLECMMVVLLFINIFWVLYFHEGKFRERLPFLIEAIGSKLMALFISISSSLAPFQCDLQRNCFSKVQACGQTVCLSGTTTKMLSLCFFIALFAWVCAAAWAGGGGEGEGGAQRSFMPLVSCFLDSILGLFVRGRRIAQKSGCSCDLDFHEAPQLFVLALESPFIVCTAFPSQLPSRRTLRPTSGLCSSSFSVPCLPTQAIGKLIAWILTVLFGVLGFLLMMSVLRFLCSMLVLKEIPFRQKMLRSETQLIWN